MVRLPVVGRARRRGGGGKRRAERDLHPWLLGAVVLVALATRLWLLAVTREQPVWWDEAEYLLKARAMALGAPDPGWVGRPIVLSLALAGFIAVGLGEIAMRVFLLAVSVAAVVLLYRVGRRLGGELVGFAAAVLFAVHGLPLFYSARIMVEVPHVALILLGIDLLQSDRRWRVMLAGPVLVLAALTRFPAALLLPVIAAYAFLARRHPPRLLALSAGLGAVPGIAFLVWNVIRFGDPLIQLRAASAVMPALDASERFSGVVVYARELLQRSSWPLMTLAAAGLLLALRDRARGVLLWGWAMVPVAYFSLFVRPIDIRFVILAVPPLLLAGADAVAVAARWVAGSRRWLTAAIVTASAGAIAALILPRATAVIRHQTTSYAELREAARWVAANSNASTEVMTSSRAQVAYYSHRATVGIPREREAFTSYWRARPDALLLVSNHEANPPWLEKGLSQELRFTRVFEPTPVRAIVRVFRVTPR
jgi:4-amino-4-deoxy-L-arabinose transferase-like glycosyltransferase